MRITSKWRLIGLLGMILLGAFSAIILIDYFSTRNSMKEEIVRTSLPLLQQNIYSTILSDLLPSMNTASMMANDYFLINWEEKGGLDITEISSYLERIQTEYGYNSVFFVSEKTGKYFIPGGINKIISPLDDHDVWYYQFIESGKEFTLDIDTDQVADNRITIFINFRLENSKGELLGVTGVGIEKEGFSKFLAEQQELFGKIIFLADSSGIIQAHSDSEKLEQIDMHELDGLGLITDEILSNKTNAFTGGYKLDRHNIVVMARYIPEIDWSVIIEYNEYMALAPARLRITQSLIIGFLAFFLVLLFSVITINRYDRRLELMVTTDSLTGTANRRALDAALPRMLYRKNRQSGDVSLILIDLDHFKAVNDKYGHQEGDAVLKSFSRTVSDEIRQNDLLVRWGGDEFLVVSETGIEGALRVAEVIRKRFANIETRVSLSIGIAVAENTDSPESLLKKADKALYTAKNSGRNRIEIS
ncbi:MAG: GGDEF domain-containing protein [Spirochaetaceae bacterium]|nr:GGDEF domain-containing protein [Spirochaetaceae bacterium]